MVTIWAADEMDVSRGWGRFVGRHNERSQTGLPLLLVLRWQSQRMTQPEADVAHMLLLLQQQRSVQVLLESHSINRQTTGAAD